MKHNVPLWPYRGAVIAVTLIFNATQAFALNNSNLLPEFLRLPLKGVQTDLNPATATCNDLRIVRNPISVAFYENTTRRQPTIEEQKPIVKLGAGCAGFFVKNTRNEFIIATASHCANYDFKSFCSSSSLNTAVTTGYGNHGGACDKVLLEDPAADVVIVKLAFAFPKDIGPDIKYLTLSAKMPPPRTRVKMIGHPGDPEAHGQLTVADNCWINGQMSNADPLYLAKRIARPFLNGAQLKSNDVFRTSAHQYYNCSVYGGNSGGPILIEGTSFVIGMPGNYNPDDFKKASANEKLNFTNAMATFLGRNAQALSSLGIVIDK